MRRHLCVPMLLVLPGLALAQPGVVKPGSANTGPIKVEQVWSRAAPQGRTGVLYMTVTDTGAPDRLVGVDTPIAEKAELHESSNEGGVMKMRPVASIPISPGAPLTLKPGGYHVMLIGLRQGLKEGESFPVTLRFAQTGAVSATAEIVKAGAPSPMGAMGEDEMDHGAMHH